MTIKIFLLTAIAITAASCQQTGKNQSAGETSADSSAQSNSDNPYNIELNKGEKWIVDAPMMQNIRKMEASVNAFDSSSPEAYKILAEQLQADIDALTTGCTMKGQGHDELHKWLLPYIDKVNAFAGAGSDAERQQILQTIKDAYTNFNQYFK